MRAKSGLRQTWSIKKFHIIYSERSFSILFALNVVVTENIVHTMYM